MSGCMKEVARLLSISSLQCRRILGARVHILGRHLGFSNSPDDDDNCFLEVGRYVAEESIADVKTGLGPNDTERVEFLDLAQEFSSLFTEAPGTTNLVQHHINLTSNEPVMSKLYPVAYSSRESLKKDIDDMIRMGVIRESNSLTPLQQWL